jgi:hypothetical protein
MNPWLGRQPAKIHQNAVLNLFQEGLKYDNFIKNEKCYQLLQKNRATFNSALQGL